MLPGLLNYLPAAGICLILTVVIELIIAMFFGIRRYGVIIASNAATQLLLHAVMMITFYTSLYGYFRYIFYSTEILIWLLEYLLYTALIRKVGHKKLLLYVLVANLTTMLVGLVIDF